MSQGPSSSWRVRPAVEDDAVEIERMVRELAEYEREPDAAQATAEDFRAALFCPEPKAFCHVAEVDTVAGTELAGMALWYLSFSTWRGRHGIWLEDLFVRPRFRALGLGRALLEELAAVGVRNGYARFEWWVLDWNESAHGFYRRLGAVPQEDWTVWRVEGDALQALGRKAAATPVGD